MKCFNIKNGKAAPGIPTCIPHDPAVPVKGGKILAAEFLLESSLGSIADQKELQRSGLGAASELAYFELTPPKKGKRPDILIAYDPVIYRCAPEYGDKGSLLYRSDDWHIVVCPCNACCIYPKIDTTDKIFFTVNDKKQVVGRKLSNASRVELTRIRMRLRRDPDTGFTTVYQH